MVMKSFNTVIVLVDVVVVLIVHALFITLSPPSLSKKRACIIPVLRDGIM